MFVGGAALVALGIVGFVASGFASPTALIPAVFGLPIAVLAVVARRRPSFRMHALHAGMFLFVLGALGSARGLGELPRLVSGTAERPLAVGAQVAMFAICLALVAAGVHSFVLARTARAR